MEGFSNIKNKLLAEQVQEQIYHYILELSMSREISFPTNLNWERNSA